ncbi:Phage capsid family protein [Crateriforma conspicua]|uniref:Phage capsid family protein n=1 Tax=Crateriforma conspicua TaxID=2527996 RepID=A0A5C6FXT2_9PLAN|nr:phage major capsid protein [Crateriforma conspicua]TWU67301.1 Phage capsid family protein [Crateriforma conspicua]
MPSIRPRQSVSESRTLRKRASLHRMIMPTLGALAMFPVMADWRDSKALREELGELVAEAEAIGRVAQEENRDLTDDESKRVDQILGVGDEGTTGFQPGLVHNLKARIRRVEKIENTRSQIASEITAGPGQQLPAQGGQNDDVGGTDGPESPTWMRSRVPVNIVQPSAAAMEPFKSVGSYQEQRAHAYALGRWFMAAICGDANSRQWCDEHGVTIQAAQTGGTPAKGGYLVPTELSTAIREVRDKYGVFRGECSYEPMMSDTKDVPVDISGHGYYFVDESAEIGETDAEWKNVALVAQKVGRITRFSSEIGEDGIIEMAAKLATDIGKSFAKAEDDCAIIADGTATYGGHTGLLDASGVGSAAVYTAPSGITSLDKLTAVHFRAAMAMLPDKFRNDDDCKWYVSPTVYDHAMAPILDAAGGNTSTDIENGPTRRRFLGAPTKFSSAMPGATTANAAGEKFAIYGNWKAGAVFGDRRTITIAESAHVFFKNDDMALRGTQRFHLKPHEIGDASDVGAFVVLELAGS